MKIGVETTHDWSMVNHPSVYGDWVDNCVYQVTLDWSNGNSDPVWAVTVTLVWPRWFMRALSCLWPARYQWKEDW